MSDIVVLYPTGLDRDFDMHLASLGFGANPGGLHHRYRREALRLNTLSDADLDRIGIARRDIPAFVMRHRFPAFAALFGFEAANS